MGGRESSIARWQKTHAKKEYTTNIIIQKEIVE